MKNSLKILLLCLMLLPCSILLTACNNTVTAVRASEAKVVFTVGEEFSFGEGKVEKKVKNEWSLAEKDDFSIDSTSFNKNQKGIYEIKVSIEEVSFSYHVLVIDTTTLVANYGETLEDIDIGIANVSFKDALTTSVGNVGTKHFTVVYGSEEFSIPVVVNKADNAWVTALTMQNFVYGDASVNPNAEAKFGTVNYVYYADNNGQIGEALSLKPTNASYYWVEAVVGEGDSYLGISSSVRFEITKATPSYEIPTNLTAEVGQTLNDVILPEGFSWKDELTTSVGEDGNNSFTAVFTPADTNNYIVVEVLVTIEVSSPAIAWPTADLEEFGLQNVSAPLGEIVEVVPSSDMFSSGLTIIVSNCTNFEAFAESVFNAGYANIIDEESGEEMTASSYTNCIIESSTQKIFSATNGDSCSVVITLDLQNNGLTIAVTKSL